MNNQTLINRYPKNTWEVRKKIKIFDERLNAIFYNKNNKQRNKDFLQISQEINNFSKQTKQYIDKYSENKFYLEVQNILNTWIKKNNIFRRYL
jgi:hypothetical protein